MKIIVTVDYDKSLEEMVNDGKYDFVATEFRPKDSIDSFSGIWYKKGQIDLEIELFQLDGPAKTEDVLLKLERMGLKSTGLPELLSLGAQYPDLQREFPIIALSTRLKRALGDIIVPCLIVFEDWRALMPMWMVEWSTICRFVAIPDDTQKQKEVNS